MARGLDARAALWLLLAAALALGCLGAPYPEQMSLQHLPTVAALLLGPVFARRLALSTVSLALLTAFLLLHVVAARYIYSYVPYDAWASSLFGTDVSSTFGFRRNHFDRLVHFCFGLFVVRPAQEVAQRTTGIGWRFALYVAVEFVLASSMLYELFEWGISLVMSPDDTEAYNGQQGDPWDAQKDMGCAMLGALAAALVLVARRPLRANGGTLA